MSNHLAQGIRSSLLVPQRNPGPLVAQGIALVAAVVVGQRRPYAGPERGVRPFWTLDGVFGRLNRSQQQSIGLRPSLMMAQMASSHLTAQGIAVIAARVCPSGQTVALYAFVTRPTAALRAPRSAHLGVRLRRDLG